MTSKLHCWNFISKTGPRATSAALAFAILLVAAVSAVPTAQAQTYTVLHYFQGAPNDGTNPTSALTLDGDRSYGATQHGGEANRGTLFTLDKAGKEKVLVSFGPGKGIGSGLVRDAADNLYASAAGGFSAAGRVVRIKPNGALITFHKFNGSDGKGPSGDLLLDSAGNIYGTTFDGGGFCDCGVVYKLDPAGNETVLHIFTGSPDGSQPLAGLVRDAAGNLYGTTSNGGNIDDGTIFKIDTAGNETVLYSFKGAPDGNDPGLGTLVLDSAGNLYGTTGGGGNGTCLGGAGCGTVFKFDTNTGTETILHSFASGADGAIPDSGLILDPAGNLFGTTDYGGNSRCNNPYPGCGTIFKLDTTGKETILHRFVGPEGVLPFGGLIRTTAGNLYGTAFAGGDGQRGVVYELKP